MSEMSDFLENELLDHVLSAATYTAPATLYYGLDQTTTVDADTGSTITEPSGNNYSRASHTNNATNWPAASSGSKSNGTAISFPVPSGSWGTVTDIGILDAATLGNLLLYTPLDTARVISGGETTVEVATSGMTWTWDTTNISDYLRDELLDHILSAAAFTAAATVYMALCTAAPTSASTGSTITEPSGNNYSRAAITNNATNFPAASGGSKSNGADITFAVPSGSWGSCTHWALVDASTAGNVYFFGAVDTAMTPDNGDTVLFSSGNFTFAFQ